MSEDVTSCAHASAHRRDDKEKVTDKPSVKDLSGQQYISASNATDAFKGEPELLKQVPNTSQRTSQDEVHLQGEVRHGPTSTPIDPAITDKSGVNDQTSKSNDVPLPKNVDDLVGGKLPDDYADNPEEDKDQYQPKNISDLGLQNLKIVNAEVLQQEEMPVTSSSLGSSDLSSTSSSSDQTLEGQGARGVVQQVKDTAVGLAQRAITSVRGVTTQESVPLPKNVDDLVGGKLPDDYADNPDEDKEEYTVKDISDLPIDNLKIINTGSLKQEEKPVTSSSLDSSDRTAERQGVRGVVRQIKDTAVGLAQRALGTVSTQESVPLPKNVDDLVGGKLPDDYADNPDEDKEEYTVKDVSDLPIDNLKIINTGSLKQEEKQVTSSGVEVPEEHQKRGVVQQIKDTAVGLAQRAIATVQTASEMVKETAIEAIHKVQEIDQRATETLNIASHRTNEKLNDFTIRAEDAGVVPEDKSVTTSASTQQAAPATLPPSEVVPESHSIKAQDISASTAQGTTPTGPSFVNKAKDYTNQAVAKAEQYGQEAQFKARDAGHAVSQQASQVKKATSEVSHNFSQKFKEYDQRLQADLQTQMQTPKQDTSNVSMQQELSRDISSKDKGVKDFAKKKEIESSSLASDTSSFKAKSSTPGSTEVITASEKSKPLSSDLSQKVQEYTDKTTEKAAEKANELKEKTSEKANELKEKATEKVNELKETATEKANEWKEKAKDIGDEASWKASEKLEKNDSEFRSHTKSDVSRSKSSSHRKTGSNIPPAPPVPADYDDFFAESNADTLNIDNLTAGTLMTAPAATTDLPSFKPQSEGLDLKDTEFPPLPSQQHDQAQADIRDQSGNQQAAIVFDVSSQPQSHSLDKDVIISSSSVNPKSYASVVAHGDTSHSTSTSFPGKEKTSELRSGTSRNRSEDVEPNAVRDQHNDLGSHSTSK